MNRLTLVVLKSVTFVRNVLPMLGVAVVALCLTAVPAFAQGSSDVVEIIDAETWTGILADIVAALTPVVLGVIGIAFGLLIVNLLMKVIKRYVFRG